MYWGNLHIVYQSSIGSPLDLPAAGLLTSYGWFRSAATGLSIYV